MDRERLEKWLERGILGLVLAILVFAPLAFGGVRASEFVVIQFLTIAIIVLWVLRVWIHPRPVLFWPPICWAVMAFVIYAIVRYRLAPIEYVARLEFIKVITYAFIFVAIVNNLSRQESTQIISMTLIVVAFVLSSFAVVQFITHYPHVWTMLKPEGYVGRGSGTFINPNNFAGFVEMILPLSLAYTLIGRFGHVSKVIFGYASLAIMVGIGVTLSRGGWVSTGLMLAIFLTVLLYQRDFRMRSFIILSILLVLGIALVAKANKSQQRFEQLKTASELKDQRFEYWKSAEQIWREDIWLGAGPAHYDYRFKQYRPANLQSTPQYVHNDYLNTLADWGIVGLGLILGFLTLFYVGVFKTWRFVQRSPNDLGTKSSNKAAFVLGGSTGILALVFHSFVDFNMHIPANAIVALTLIALVTTYIRFATETFWSSLGWLRKLAMTLIGLAGIFYLGQQALIQTKEFFLLNAASEESKDANRKMTLLEKVFAVEPKNFETADMIGEILRAKSFLGNRDYETDAQEAMKWYQRSMDLNPFNPLSQFHYGMCLDWLGKNDEAGKYFERSRVLDPNGYYTIEHLGWHLLQLGDYAGAQKLFRRSQDLVPNQMAESYLDLIENRMREDAK